MLMTAEGSGLLIQKYDAFNPSMLNELMLNEITKESLNYGFEMKRMDYERTLKSGEKLKVLKAVLSYKGEVNVYEISSYGKKDEGIMIMTMTMNQDISKIGTKMINLMWESLEILSSKS